MCPSRAPALPKRAELALVLWLRRGRAYCQCTERNSQPSAIRMALSRTLAHEPVAGAKVCGLFVRVDAIGVWSTVVGICAAQRNGPTRDRSANRNSEGGNTDQFRHVVAPRRGKQNKLPVLRTCHQDGLHVSSRWPFLDWASASRPCDRPIRSCPIFPDPSCGLCVRAVRSAREDAKLTDLISITSTV